ncbi:DUF2339 domain-containing protein [Salinibius halmophilus]|uniref:DUF2339 domain-containing protein n=1 Tax=Salinibius halmophilus TaxID=1853216 RepID=UPI001314DA50|nr:DUF2339 domain-containing protein [Salinibius halmophilus]
MDAGIILLALWVIIGPTAIAIWAIASVQKLKQRVRVLERKAAFKEANESIPDNTARDEESDSALEAPVETPAEPETTPVPAEPISQPTKVYDLPASKPPLSSTWTSKVWQSFKANWLVWIGGLALLIGMGYLVQVIGSNFSIPPLARISLASIISLAVIMLGEYLHKHRKDGLHFAYIPAAVTAAGKSGLYGTVLFAYLDYQLLGPSSAMLMLAVVAWVSIALTQRQGPLMAALGMLAGFAAPLFIDSQQPNLWLLSAYLFSIVVAGQLVSQRVKRAWLGYFNWPFMAVWLLLLASQSTLIASIALPVAYYLLVLVPRQGWRLKTNHSPAFWQHPNLTISALLAASALVVSIYNNEQMLWMSWALLACVWLPVLVTGRSHQLITWDTLVFAIVWLLLVLVYSDVSWQLLAVPALVWARLMLQGREPLDVISHWFSIFWLPASLTALHLSDMLVGDWRLIILTALAASVLAANQLSAQRQAMFCSAHILLALLSYFALPGGYFVAAIAAQVALLAWLANQQNWQPSTWLIKAALLAISLLFTAAPFVGDWQLANLLPYGLLGGAVLALLLLGRHLLTGHALLPWYNGGILHVFAVWLLVLGQLWLDVTNGNEFARLCLASAQTFSLSALYWWRSGTSSHKLYQYYAQALLALGAVVMLLLLTVQLPYLSYYESYYEASAGWRVLNWMLVGYLVPAVLFAWQAKQNLLVKPISGKVYVVAAAALATLWINLAIRNIWQGGQMAIDYGLSNSELYSYSVVWLVLGITMTIFAAAKRQTVVQTIGLGLLALVSCKVFLIDASELDGVLRAASFIGLGAALVALGWIFQRLQSKKHAT